jgi:hypothetical protein
VLTIQIITILKRLICDFNTNFEQKFQKRWHPAQK